MRSRIECRSFKRIARTEHEAWPGFPQSAHQGDEVGHAQGEGSGAQIENLAERRHVASGQRRAGIEEQVHGDGRCRSMPAEGWAPLRNAAQRLCG